MSCWCDFNPPEFYLKKTVKAKKNHRCDECCQNIPKGHNYEVVTAKWDGDIARFKTCLNCVGLREYTESNVKCVCWAHGNMVEDCIGSLKEFSHELPGLLFGGYRFIAKRKIKKQGVSHGHLE